MRQGWSRESREVKSSWKGKRGKLDGVGKRVSRGKRGGEGEVCGKLEDSGVEARTLYMASSLNSGEVVGLGAVRKG